MRVIHGAERCLLKKEMGTEAQIFILSYSKARGPAPPSWAFERCSREDGYGEERGKISPWEQLG